MDCIVHGVAESDMTERLSLPPTPLFLSLLREKGPLSLSILSY